MLGKLISAASSAIGGLMDRSAQKKERGIALNQDNTTVQRRTADSLAAGIHPLFGLGVSPSSYSGTTVGGMASALGNAGQDIGAAVDKMRTPDQRATALDQRLLSLQLRRGELENLLLETQLRREAQTPVPAPPSMGGDLALIPGQGDTRVGRSLVIPAPGQKVSNWKSGRQSDAQDVENRYGEFAGDTYGLLSAYVDAHKNPRVIIDAARYGQDVVMPWLRHLPRPRRSSVVARAPNRRDAYNSQRR